MRRDKSRTKPFGQTNWLSTNFFCWNNLVFNTNHDSITVTQLNFCIVVAKNTKEKWKTGCIYIHT